MNYSILMASLLLLVGCGETDSKDGNTTIIERTEVSIPNDSVIMLDNNESVGYKPNTDVTIINVGDGSYYISCPEGDSCEVFIDNSSDNSNHSESTSSSSVSTVQTESNTYVGDTNETNTSN
jgi:hypothetical protein